MIIDLYEPEYVEKRLERIESDRRRVRESWGEYVIEPYDLTWLLEIAQRWAGKQAAGTVEQADLHEPAMGTAS